MRVRHLNPLPRIDHSLPDDRHSLTKKSYLPDAKDFSKIEALRDEKIPNQYQSPNGDEGPHQPVSASSQINPHEQDGGHQHNRLGQLNPTLPRSPFCGIRCVHHTEFSGRGACCNGECNDRKKQVRQGFSICNPDSEMYGGERWSPYPERRRATPNCELSAPSQNIWIASQPMRRKYFQARKTSERVSFRATLRPLEYKANRLAGKHGAYTEPHGQKRGWFICPNRCSPHDLEIAKTVLAGIEAAGGFDAFRKRSH